MSTQDSRAPLNRRRMLQAAALGTAGAALAAEAASAALRPAPGRVQTNELQDAIDDAARRGAPLVLPPGNYLTGMLRLPDGAHLIGARGATRLVFDGNGSGLFAADGATRVTLSGLAFDGGGHKLPPRRGLVHIEGAANLVISDCAFDHCGASALWLARCSGRIETCRFTAIADTAILSYDGAGLAIRNNEIEDCGDNGIEILRAAQGEDGAIVSGNRISRISARAAGSGQHGNAIVLHRAGGAIVIGNHIRDCDYSAVRANSTKNIQIADNNIADMREVAIYSEFAFEGTIISGNVVDGAALGVSVCNFNEGGRLAIVKGNIIRNLYPERAEGSRADGQGGIGIYVEADSIVSGNIVEKAPLAGLFAGWGRYVRDVSLSDNIVRDSGIGIAVSADRDAGLITISDNLLSGCQKGAIVGMDHARVVTADLMRGDAKAPAHIVLSANRAT